MNLTTPRGPSSNTTQPQLVQWRASPGGRGTLDIFTSCTATLTLCVWTVLSLNIPPIGQRRYKTFSKKLLWLAMGIFIPEFVVLLAFEQLYWARQLHACLPPNWNLSHAFYVQMGGFVAVRRGCQQCYTFHNSRSKFSVKLSVRHLATRFSRYRWIFTIVTHHTKLQSHDVSYEDFLPSPPAAALSSSALQRGNQETSSLSDTAPGNSSRIDFYDDGLNLKHYDIVGSKSLSHLAGSIPTVVLDDIMDKNKSDGLAKLIISAQSMWFLLQLLGRQLEHLPITLIEINTAVHILCALAVYILWWYKPQGVCRPTVIKINSLDFSSPGTDILDRPPQHAMREGGLKRALIYPVLELAYGGLHALAWSASFPSAIEQWCWRIASLFLITFGFISLFFICIVVFLPAGFRKLLTAFTKMQVFLVLLFILAKLYITIESVASLRSLPEGAFTTPSWSNILPHF